MILPKVLQPRPARLLMLLGGFVGTILVSSMIYLAPVFGLPFVDFPLLSGGVFTTHEESAFWLGYALVFVGGTIVLPIIVTAIWTLLPGNPVTVPGAALKGVVLGTALWVLSGVLLPLAGALSPLVDNPGFFAESHGVVMMIGILVGHLLYGLALTLVGGMSGGLRPMDTLGWPGFGYGDVREAALQHPSRKAYGRLGRSA